MGCAVVIEAAGEPGGYTDLQLRRFAQELDAGSGATLSAEDHSRYGAVILLAEVDRVGEALAVAVGHFGAAVDFSGLPAWPIGRVEITHCEVPEEVSAHGVPTAAPWLRAADGSAEYVGPSAEDGVRTCAEPRASDLRRRGSWRVGRRRLVRR